MEKHHVPVGHQFSFCDYSNLQKKHKKLISKNPNPDSITIVEIKAIEDNLSEIKETAIKSIPQHTNRLLQVVPSLLKFPWVKTNPRELKQRVEKGIVFKEVRSEDISFRNIKATIHYKEGELSDLDRLVYFAIENRFIKYIDFIIQIGFVPISLDQIASDIGYNQRIKISAAIKKLRNTEIETQTKKDRISRKAFLGEEDIIGVKELRAAIENDLMYVVDPKLRKQAQEILDGIKPKTPSISLFSPDQKKIKMIKSNNITSIDLWYLKKLKKTWERTLYLFLWDKKQLHLKYLENHLNGIDVNDYQIRFNITELSRLLDLKPKKVKRKDKVYFDYSLVSKKITKTINTIIDHGGKYAVWANAEGRGKAKTFVFQFPIKDQRQIPKKAIDSKQAFFNKHIKY